MGFEAWDGRASVEGMRAFHELWCPHDFQTILARAPIDAAGERYAELAGAVDLERDVGHRELPGDSDGHFLLQMCGCPWTAILFDLGGGGVELDGMNVARGLSRMLDTEVIYTSAHDGASAYQLYNRGKRGEGFDEGSRLEAIDVADEARFEAAAREAARRYHAAFESRNVWLPPAEEDRDGARTRLILYGVDPERVRRVDYAVFGRR